MPEEIEVPTEHLHEAMHEKAHEEGGGFNMRIALGSALLAVLAAVAALLAGHAANEAMLKQLEASDKWAYYQAKSIKSSVLNSKMELLKAMGRKNADEDLKKADEYQKQMEDIKKEAEGLEAESGAEMKTHVILARSVTFFQIAIALSAMAVLTKRRELFYGGLGLGIIGLFFFAMGLL